MLPISQEALQSVPQLHAVEIEQQRLARATQSQICKDLRGVKRQKPLNAFHPDDDVALD
jgi:hypothetical protein